MLSTSAFLSTFYWVSVFQQKGQTYRIAYTLTPPEQMIFSEAEKLVYTRRFNNMIDALRYILLLENISNESIERLIPL